MIVFLNAYVGLLCLSSFLILWSKAKAVNPQQGLNYIQEIASIGQSVFHVALIAQSVVALLVAPLITATMITAERERQTLEFLRVTTIRPSTFIAGGLLSTMLYVVLAQVCALPVLCVPFLYGGVSPGEVVGWMLSILSGGLLLCSIGIWLSSVNSRSRAAQGAMLSISLLTLFSGLFLLPALRNFTGAIGLFAPMWMTVSLFGNAVIASGWQLFVVGCVGLSATLFLFASWLLYRR